MCQPFNDQPPDETDGAALIAAIEAQARIVDHAHEGVCVRWRIWGGGAHKILLLHGNGGSWLHWLRNIPVLARETEIIVPDLPGFGSSDAPPPPCDAGALARPLVAAARGLIDDGVVGNGCATLAGFSMGASVAVELAAALGPRVSDLVLVGAGRGFGIPSASPPPLTSWRRHADRQARRDAHRHNCEALMLGPERPTPDLAVEIQARGNEKMRARFVRERDPARLHALIRGLDCPLTAIWGEEDVVMRGHREDRIAYFGSARPGARLVFLPGAGHWTQFERPEPINAILLGRG